MLALLPLLCGPAHQNPSGLGLGQEARSPDAALVILLPGQIALTPPAWAHCPVKKGNEGAWRDHIFTLSVSHTDTANGTKDLRF